MKFSRLLTTATALSLAAASFSTSAGTQTATMNVLAAVVPKCTIATIADLDFGTYVQESGNIDASTNIGVTCPAATAYTVALSGLTSGRTMANGGSLLTYNLYSDVARSTVWGSVAPDLVSDVGTGLSVLHPVYGRIVDSPANRLIPAGAYTGVVTVTVAY
jgi:spore coat protein U-like protein